MTLVNDLVQALLIPLATWELHVLGGEVAVPVSPLMLMVAGGVAGRVLRLGWRRLSGPMSEAPGESAASVPVLRT